MTTLAEIAQDLASLRQDVARLKAVQDIQNLMGTYTVNHMPKTMHDHVELFAMERDDVSVEIGDRGVLVGPDALRRLFGQQFKMELEGNLLIHYLATPMIEVAGDGETAKGVWRSPGIEAVRPARWRQARAAVVVRQLRLRLHPHRRAVEDLAPALVQDGQVQLPRRLGRRPVHDPRVGFPRRVLASGPRPTTTRIRRRRAGTGAALSAAVRDLAGRRLGGPRAGPRGALSQSSLGQCSNPHQTSSSWAACGRCSG